MVRTNNGALAFALLLAGACQSTASDEIGGHSEALGGDDYYDAPYDASFENVYPVASFSGVVARTAGPGGAPIPANFYFPDVNTADHIDSFPMVPLLQGGNVPKEEYSEFATKLASFGFVVVVPDLRQSFGPPGSPQMLLTSQWVANWVANDLTQRDADGFSPLHNIVDTSSMGLLGHSFGAAAALAVVQGTCQPPFCFGPPFGFYQRPASLKAAVAHGFQNCDPGTGQCLYPNTSAAPSMIINGGLDDPGAPTQNAYQSLARPRGLAVLDGVNHFGLCNEDLSQRPGSQNPEKQEIKQKLSIKRTARWTALWLRAHILGDAAATALVFESGGVEQATVTAEM